MNPFPCAATVASAVSGFVFGKGKDVEKNDHERCGQSVGCVRREPQSLPHFRTNKMAGVGRACEPTWAWASRGSWGRPLGRAPAASPCAPRSRSWADRACTRVPCTCLESRLHPCPVRVAPGQQQQYGTSGAATTTTTTTRTTTNQPTNQPAATRRWHVQRTKNSSSNINEFVQFRPRISGYFQITLSVCFFQIGLMIMFQTNQFS